MNRRRANWFFTNVAFPGFCLSAPATRCTEIIVGFVLATAIAFWVALLMGFASGLLTNG